MMEPFKFAHHPFKEVLKEATPISYWGWGLLLVIIGIIIWYNLPTAEPTNELETALDNEDISIEN